MLCVPAKVETKAKKEEKIIRCGNESKRNEAAAVDFKEMSKSCIGDEEMRTSDGVLCIFGAVVTIAKQLEVWESGPQTTENVDSPLLQGRSAAPALTCQSLSMQYD